MIVLPAHLVATPVLERLAGEPRGLAGVVLGAGAGAAWVDLDGFVAAVTTREAPLLPNAVALAAGSGSLHRPGVVPGATARLAPGRIDLGAVRVTWDPTAPPAWDPTVPVPVDGGPEAAARRGAALLAALGSGSRPVAPGPAPTEPATELVDSRGKAPAGSATFPLRGPRRPGAAWSPARPSPNPPQARVGGLANPVHDPGHADPSPDGLVRELARVGLPTAGDPGGAAGLSLLFRAVRERHPEPAARAASALLGRGPGLTPEGDDLLAAVAGTLAVLGPATGLDGPDLTGFLAALAAPPGRTTALSATLLALASRRRLAEPAGRLLDLGPGSEAAWPAALGRLERLGHGSGRAYAAGIAATACLLAAGPPIG